MTDDFLPYFKVFPAETLADERFSGWTMEERGTWHTFLLHAWVNGSIPADEAALARIAHMTPRAFAKVWKGIADRFIPHPDQPGRLTSRRLEMEREEASARAEAGRTGARSRWQKRPGRNATPDATAQRPECDRIAEPMPTAQHSATQLSTTQIARIARVGVGHPAFEAIEHWRSSTWPKLSTAGCPDVTTTQAQSLAGLSGKHGPDTVRAAMDAAAADPYWAKTLDLDTFLAKFPKFLGRRAAPVKAPQSVDRDFSKTLAET